MQALGPRAEKKSIANSKDVRVSIPGEQLKKVTESIKEAVEMGAVTIAFPQRDVHLDATGPLEVRVVSESSGSEASKRFSVVQTQSED